MGVLVIKGEGNAQTVFSDFLNETGIHRIQIILTGMNDTGQRGSRTLDRTLRVAEFGKGAEWKDSKMLNVHN